MRQILLYLIMLLTGCTYSINLVHTKGNAKDVVDEVQTSSPTISPTVSIPAIP